MAGRRFRCKACGAVGVVPQAVQPQPPEAPVVPVAQWDAPPPQWPAPAESEMPGPASALPPPLPVPVIAAQTAFAGQHPQYGAPFPPPRKSSGKGVMIAIVVGVIVFLTAAGGILVHFQNDMPVIFMSDSTLQSRLAGTWSIAHTPAGNITGTIAFDANNHYHLAMKMAAGSVGYGGTYELKQHKITLIMPGPQFGTVAPAGQRLAYGIVRKVTDTTLVLATDYGDETYTRSSTPSH